MRIRQSVAGSVLSVVIAGVVAVAPAAVAQPLAPEQADIRAASNPFRLKTDQIDMGTLRPSTQRKTTFEVFNASRFPVTLTRVTGTCTCVGGLPEGRQVVPPGETGEITVTLKARATSGPVQEPLTVWYLDPEQNIERNFRVTIVGEVALAVKAEPFFLNLLGERKGAVVLSSPSGEPFRVVSTDGREPSFDLRLYPGDNPDPHQPATRHAVWYNFTDVPDEELPQFWIIETDHPEAAIIDLRMIHRGMIAEATKSSHPWALTHDRVILGQMAAGDDVEFSMGVVGADKDQPFEATIDADFIGVEVFNSTPASDRVNYDVRFSIQPGAPKGLHHKRLTMRNAGVEQTISLFVRVGDAE